MYTEHLQVLVSHLTAVHAYTAVVEICLAAARRKDPQVSIYDLQFINCY